MNIKDFILGYHIGKQDGGGGGGGSNILIVHEDTDTYTLDKTWQELYDFIANDGLAFIVSHFENDEYKNAVIIPIQTVKTDDGVTFQVEVYVGGDIVLYITDSADGYPVQD